tara:strand:+ start:252 stop:437 length:186 start_codon:yes stop_codon:yes gene_type:complete
MLSPIGELAILPFSSCGKKIPKSTFLRIRLSKEIDNEIGDRDISFSIKNSYLFHSLSQVNK